MNTFPPLWFILILVFMLVFTMWVVWENSKIEDKRSDPASSNKETPTPLL